MEKEIIGEILNKRIAEMGYTQQQFADMMGMNKDTLRSYMNGSSAYSYVLLMEFAEKLDCSYDYLLGYSKSPKREYHEVTEQTRLSTEAIDKLAKYAKHYDDEFEAQRYIDLLDMMIIEDGVMNTIFDYIISSRFVDGMYKTLVELNNQRIMQHPIIQKMGIGEDYVLNLEYLQLIHVVQSLTAFKRAISPQWIERIKRQDSYEEFLQQIEKVKQQLSNLTLEG